MSLSNYPTIRPSLVLDFQKAEVVDPRITFTRASTATRFNSYGVLETVANDIPRIDFNPTTLVCNGLLVEESRTNSIRNNTMVGAAAGTPGTLPTNWSFFEAGSELTSAVVATGTENGITYIDIKVSGTVTAQRSALIFFEPTTGVGASASQSWTQSLYLKLQAGSTANIEQINIRTDYYSSVPAFLSSTVSSALTVTSAALNTQRQSNSVTTPASTAFIQPMVRVRTNASGAIDITLRIGLPQLELGAFATSVIPTSTATVTRQADVASMTGTNFSSWYNQSAGTFLTVFSLARPSSGSNQFTVRASDNGYNNAVGINTISNGFPSIATVSGGVFDGLATAVTPLTANVAVRFIGCYATNDLAVSLNGAAVVTDTSATIPTGMTRLDIGSDHAGFNRFQSGYIQRISYYNYRVSNAQLQALTGS